MTRSLSNLYKQYNTIEPAKHVRMIDNNAIVEQKLAELVRKQSGVEQTEEKGFQELGYVAEKVEPEDPEELLQSAKEESDALLKKAREEAEETLALAKEQSKQVLAQAREEGHRQGYEEGFHQAKEELGAEYAQKAEELKRQGQEQQEAYECQMRELEPKLLDVVLDVVQKVFHIRFADQKEILLYLIGNAIANIENCKSFRIRVGGEQKEFLECHRKEILERVGCDLSLEIVLDLSLEGNQCIIETDAGIFDCSMDVQMENLIRDLKALSFRG